MAEGTVVIQIDANFQFGIRLKPADGGEIRQYVAGDVLEIDANEAAEIVGMGHAKIIPEDELDEVKFSKGFSGRESLPKANPEEGPSTTGAPSGGDDGGSKGKGKGKNS